MVVFKLWNKHAISPKLCSIQIQQPWHLFWALQHCPRTKTAPISTETPDLREWTQIRSAFLLAVVKPKLLANYDHFKIFYSRKQGMVELWLRYLSCQFFDVKEIDNVFRANSYVFLCNKSKSILNDQFTEAAIFRIFCSCHRSSRPGVFFKVSQNLQENTCVTVSSLIKLLAIC